MKRRYSPECVEDEFCELRQEFIRNSSPLASVVALVIGALRHWPSSNSVQWKPYPYCLVVRFSSLVISMAGLMDTATGQLSSYTSTTRSMVSRSFSSAVRWRVCLILLSTRTLFSVSTSPTVSA